MGYFFEEELLMLLPGLISGVPSGPLCHCQPQRSAEALAGLDSCD